MAHTVLVLHGPNLPLRGQAGIDRRLAERADELGVELLVLQANGEEGLLDALHEHADGIDAVLVNPGVLAPVSFGLAEGLRLVDVPAVEVLLEVLPPGRGPSALADVVKAQVHGKGADGYLEALALLAEGASRRRRAERAEPDEEEEGEGDDVPALRARAGKSVGRRESAPVSSPRGGKTIGRRAPVAEPEPSSPSSKTIGRGARAEASVARASVATPGLLTRAAVREQVTLRLKGKLSPEALAAWARVQWTALQADAPCEAGARDTLDSVLLTLMAGVRANDHILLAQIAKLDR